MFRHYLDDPGVDVPGRKQRRTGVPEIVGASEQRVEGAVHEVARAERGPGYGGEDEVLIPPERPEPEILILPGDPVPLRRRDGPGSEVNAPAAHLCLRLGGVQLAAPRSGGFLDEPGVEMPDGEFRDDMVASVGFYAGKVGDGGWISSDGQVMLLPYPFRDKLL